MSALQLCDLLETLGCTTSLDPQTFDWVFHNFETLPVLQWLCTNVGIRNFLSDHELQHYEELETQGRVLQGEDLEAAYRNTPGAGGSSLLEPERTSESSVRAETEALIDEASRLSRRLKAARQQDAMLAAQASSLSRGRRALGASAASTQARLASAEERLMAENAKLNAILEDLRDHADELARLHSGAEEGAFLSFMDLQPFIAQDRAYSDDLQQWFDATFSQDPQSLLEEQEDRGPGSPSSATPPPHIATIQGGSKKSRAHKKHVSEIQRLCSIYGVGEYQLVEARVASAAAQAQLATAQAQAAAAQRLLPPAASEDELSLRHKLVDLDSQLASLTRKQSHVKDEAIVQLCRDVAQLQGTHVYEGDYDMKLMRQQRHISQQQQFADYLVEQLSHHMVLDLACSAEKCAFADARDLLLLLEHELRLMADAAASRIERSTRLADAAASSGTARGATLQDPILARLQQLSTCAGAQVPWPATAEGMEKQMGQLQQDLRALLKEAQQGLPQDLSHYISLMEDVVGSLHKRLHSSSATAQLQLTPPVVAGQLAKVEEADKRFTLAVDEVNREHQARLQALKRQAHELTEERHVFVDFFCNPNKLRAYMSELSAKLRGRALTDQSSVSRPQR